MHFDQSWRVFLLRRKNHGSAGLLQRASAGAALAATSLSMASCHRDAMVQSLTTAFAIGRDVVQLRFMHDPAFTRTWIGHASEGIRRRRRREETFSLRTVAEHLHACIEERLNLPARDGGAKSQKRSEQHAKPSAVNSRAIVPDNQAPNALSHHAPARNRRVGRCRVQSLPRKVCPPLSGAKDSSTIRSMSQNKCVRRECRLPRVQQMCSQLARP